MGLGRGGFGRMKPEAGYSILPFPVITVTFIECVVPTVFAVLKPRLLVPAWVISSLLQVGMVVIFRVDAFEGPR